VKIIASIEDATVIAGHVFPLKDATFVTPR
jgi:hypothetical protein